MSSHSQGWGVDGFQSREAGLIRTAAKREDKVSLEFSRQDTVRQALWPSLVGQASWASSIASFLAKTGA